MSVKKTSVFEKHPKKTLLLTTIFFLALLYALLSIKFINNRYTEFENKSIKTLFHQYYIANIIDNNIGRFIKLREHRPHSVKMERPTRHYLKNIAPATLERKYYRVATDQYGFIGPSNIYEKPDVKIIFLGGSTTECLYMEEDERFPYLVGRNLEKRTGKKINSYNGGVSANESMHSLNILMNKVLPLKPQIVVLMHNINDLVALRSQGSYWYANSLKSHVQTAKNVFTRYEFPELPHKIDENDMINQFGKNLETFIAICKIRDIQPVLMTQANRVTGDVLYHQFNEIIRMIAKKENVLLIDLASVIPKTTEYLYDPYHYTAKGSKLAAHTISTHLENPVFKI